MRLRLDTLIKPVDPVVAVHESSRDANAAIAALRRAGYGDGMLSVIGQARHGVGPVDFQPVRPCGASRWAASGLGLGLLWALFTVAAVVPHPSVAVAFLVLVTMGALALALQAAVVARVVATGAAMPLAVASGAPRTAPRADAPAWRFLVVVHGNRSELALARDILAAH